uniref:S1 motif domain-containing protein n=1 Tax=Ananas comosus var. bracteatus TaxID=296719 RepID=A0A6V7PSP0_ANACO|nr:unnamed protein product [Ananas comosus var. bracteatus]
MPNLECRMYEAKYPEVDMAVMIQVKHIADMGAYVSLLEYNNIEGMILFSELSRRRIRSVSSLIKVGRQEPVMVLRVDRDKGYIDLSKRRVSEEDIQACEERYNKSKLVHSIMRHVAETLDLDLEDLYVHVGWPLYRKYGHAFEAFKLIVTDPDSVLDPLTREVKEDGPDGQAVTKAVPAMTPEVKDALVKNIRRRMTPQPLKIRADIEMKCFQFDGVLHIKEAMRKAEAAGSDDCPVKIKLVAPPLYVLTTQTLDKGEEDDLFVYTIRQVSSPATPIPAPSATVRPSIVHVYSRRLATPDSDPSPASSSEDPVTTLTDLASDSDLSIALRKGKQSVSVPKSVVEALSHPGWRAALEEEMMVLDANGTWELVPLPADKRAIGCKWVFTVKMNPDGSVARLKARIVAKGYAQT